MRGRNLTTALSAALVLFCTAVIPVSWADEEEPEFSELRVFIEINATDGDVGFQAMVDADEWKEVTLSDPDGKLLYMVKGFGRVREQGLTENFFESAEPSCDEFPLADFLDRFPEGDYLFSGKTIDGDRLEGEAVLTHVLPGAPENLSPTGDGIDPAGSVTITWTAGSGLGECPADGAYIVVPDTENLFGFQVVVEREDPEPLVVFSADLPATATSVTIPAEFLQADAIYKYEVVAIEGRENDDGVERGNQTISEDFFCTFEGTCELPE